MISTVSVPRIIVVLIGLWGLYTPAVVAQDHPTAEELYQKARTIAFQEKDYGKAREYAYKALNMSPNYHGIRIFIARLYGWEGSYDNAREELQEVLEQDPGNRRALLTFINVEQWSGHLQTALQKARQALEYHPEDKELQLQEGSLLYKLEEFAKAKKRYQRILEQYPSSQEAREGLKSTQLKLKKYQLTLSYRNDQFVEHFDPWRFLEVGLKRQTPYGSVTGWVQYAHRFGSNGAQFNVDAYPSITEGLYAYVSGGYSQSSIHPRYRFGFSVYKLLPAAFEVEAGIRYLDFESNQTNIYTVSMTKYWGRYLFTVRPFYVSSAGGSSQSLNIVVRRYFGPAHSYIGFTGGFGSTATDIQFSQDVQTRQSRSVEFDGQYPLSERVFIGGRAGYDSAELRRFTRKRFSFEGFVSYRF